MYRLLTQCRVSFKHAPYRIYQATESSTLIASGYNYSTVSKNGLFIGISDRFNGITVDLTKEKCAQEQFNGKLEDSLKQWQSQGKRCIWFKVNIKDATHVPILARKGFNFHHARNAFVMMYKWLPKDSDPNLPPSCYTNLGVGAMVFNKENQLLAITETAYEYPHWKLPGGYVERDEDIVDAAVREVKEETGVDCAFESLVTFRHSHNMMFGNSDVYILMRMRALTEKIEISSREIKACQWMEIEEYTNHPHVHDFNRLIIKKALEYKDKNIKLNFVKKHVKWATFERDMHYLVLEDI